MSNDDTNPNIARVEHAARALDAYERTAFPNDRPALPGDPIYSQAMLGALICDLEHWADAYGVDFNESLESARGAYTDEVAEQARYEIGDQVRLRLQPERCGTVTDVQAGPDGTATYQVHVAGVPYLHAEQSVHLAEAPPFPPIETSHGLVERADQAEATLIELAAHARRSGPNGDITGKEESDQLLAALSFWSGSTTYELIKDLAPKIANRIITLLNERAEVMESDTAETVQQTDAVRLSADDFPYDLGNGIPASDPASDMTPRPTRSSPGRGPGQAA